MGGEGKGRREKRESRRNGYWREKARVVREGGEESGPLIFQNVVAPLVTVTRMLFVSMIRLFATTVIGRDVSQSESEDLELSNVQRNVIEQGI